MSETFNENQRLRDERMLLGYVVVEPDPDGGVGLMLGTPIFEVDDLASAESCLEGDAFIAEVREALAGDT